MIAANYLSFDFIPFLLTQYLYFVLNLKSNRNVFKVAYTVL